MCICLIQFQHNSYPCNTLRTLAYGYMRYKLRVWLKITGVSISIIFHKIDSRERLHRQDQNPLQDRTGEKSPTHTRTHTHTPQPSADLTRHHIPQVNFQNSNTAGLSIASQLCLVWLDTRVQRFVKAICDAWTREQSSLLEIWNQNWDQITFTTVWPWAIFIFLENYLEE